MLNLQPLIARLVEDVLRAIRGATLAELRVLASPAAKPPARKASRASAPPQRRRRQPTVPSGARGGAKRSTPAPTTAPPEPAGGGADITDPEQLLATTWQPQPALAESRSIESLEPVAEPPSSTVRPAVGSVVKLRDGETLARASGAGVIIRRSKRS